jgi:hypothetical protein
VTTKRDEWEWGWNAWGGWPLGGELMILLQRFEEYGLPSSDWKICTNPDGLSATVFFCCRQYPA